MKISQRSRNSIARKIEKEIQHLKVLEMAVLMGLPVSQTNVAKRHPGNDCAAKLNAVANSLRQIANRIWDK